MRTGGAGLSQSSESPQASTHSGPAVSIGALGCSIWSGGLPSGIEIWSAASSTGPSNALANITRAVDVNNAPGRRSRSVGRQPTDGLGDLVGGRDPAERNVGDDLRSAAASQIFLGHFRD